MNYYKRHLGDYARDTRHLSMAEHGAYTLLLDYFYATERPIPDDRCERIANAYATDEQKAVRNVLNEFFTLTDDGWIQNKALSVIRDCADKSLKAKEAAEKRWSKKRNADAMRTQCERNASHYSTTPLNKGAAKTPPDGLPDWLPEQVWTDWHDYRNSRKGWTKKAKQLSLSTLKTLRDQGHDPKAVVEQSIERGWSGLFPIKSAGQTQQPKPRQRKNL